MAKEKFTPSTELQTKMDVFANLDKQLKDMWAGFYEKNREFLDSYEEMREKRNIALDEMRRRAREEADEVDITKMKSVSMSPFMRVQKSEEHFFIKDMFLSTARNLGIETILKERGAIVETVEIPYEQAKSVLMGMPFSANASGADAEKTMLDNFLHCEDGRERTPSVFSPKPIPPLATEYKEK